MSETLAEDLLVKELNENINLNTIEEEIQQIEEFTNKLYEIDIAKIIEIFEIILLSEGENSILMNSMTIRF